MLINSSIPLSCTSAKGAFDHTISLNGNQTRGPDGQAVDKVFRCDGTPTPPRKPINKLAYGLGLTFGLGGGIAVFLGIAFCWRARNQNREARALGITKKEMLARRAAASKGKGSEGMNHSEGVGASEHSGWYLVLMKTTKVYICFQVGLREQYRTEVRIDCFCFIGLKYTRDSDSELAGRIHYLRDDFELEAMQSRQT